MLMRPQLYTWTCPLESPNNSDVMSALAVGKRIQSAITAGENTTPRGRPGCKIVKGKESTKTPRKSPQRVGRKSRSGRFPGEETKRREHFRRSKVVDSAKRSVRRKLQKHPVTFAMRNSWVHSA